MKDLISRQAVLNLLHALPPEEVTTKAILIQSVQQMNAAQPEVAKDTNVLTNDCISRQEAIDALRTHERKASKKWFDNQLDIEWNNAIDICCYDIEDLPSAQPEIIHCGECKWFQCNMRPDGYLPKGVEEYECRHWCGCCDPVDFCSYAERRTDG